MSKRQNLIDAVDAACSRYIRLRDSNFKGNGRCITCGKVMAWKGDGANAGHFIPKGNGAGLHRWTPHNIFFQCAGCNIQSGEQYLYGKFHESMFGSDDFMWDLKRRRNHSGEYQFIPYYTDDDLREIKKLYGFLADRLEANDPNYLFLKTRW